MRYGVFRYVFKGREKGKRSASVNGNFQHIFETATEHIFESSFAPLFAIF